MLRDHLILDVIFIDIKKITNNNINKDYYIPNFFCYGQSEIDDCKEFGIKVDNFYKTGSIRIANFFRYLRSIKLS